MSEQRVKELLEQSTEDRRRPDVIETVSFVRSLAPCVLCPPFSVLWLLASGPCRRRRVVGRPAWVAPRAKRWQLADNRSPAASRAAGAGPFGVRCRPSNAPPPG